MVRSTQILEGSHRPARAHCIVYRDTVSPPILEFRSVTFVRQCLLHDFRLFIPHSLSSFPPVVLLGILFFCFVLFSFLLQFGILFSFVSCYFLLYVKSSSHSVTFLPLGNSIRQYNTFSRIESPIQPEKGKAEPPVHTCNCGNLLIKLV